VFYGGGTTNLSYASGGGATWSVEIVADAGMEIFFEGFRLARPPGTTETNFTITAATNGVATTATTVAPTWSNNVFTRTYAGAARPRGTSIVLTVPDGSGDFAMDNFTFTFAAIPEPTVLAPMALAATGLFLRRRRS
jgi:hypothetical protein